MHFRRAIMPLIPNSTFADNPSKHLDASWSFESGWLRAVDLAFSVPFLVPNRYRRKGQKIKMNDNEIKTEHSQHC